MHRWTRILALSLAISTILGARSVGAVPVQVPYSGQLSEAGELVNGARSMTFRICRNPACSGGDQLYTQTIAAVPVTNGAFSVLIGSDNALQSTVFKTAGLLLKVSVGATDLGDVPLPFSPYAADTPDSVLRDGSRSMTNNLNLGGHDVTNGGAATFTSATLTGDLAVQGNMTFGNMSTDTSTFTSNVDALAGVDVSGNDLTVGGNKFSVDDATGNTSVAGTLGVTGATNLGGHLDVAAGITAGSGSVPIADATGKLPAINATNYASLNGSALTSLTAANITGTITDAQVSDTLTASDLVASSAVVSDAEVSDTLTASDLVAASAVVSDAEVADNLTISGGSVAAASITGTITDAQVSDTLTSSNLVAGSSVVSNAEVDNDLTISGGTVDNTIIGGTTPAAGSFTTVGASGLATLNGGATVGSDNTDLVTFNATVQGGSPLVFEGATANTNETTLVVTDPTADRTITFPDAGGEASLLGQTISDSEVDNNLTIDGGTINNSVIGGTTAAAGSFTTVSASGLASLNGGATVGSDNTDLVTVNAVVQGATPLVFEGATANTSETTLVITDPTADRTVTFPDAGGEVSLLAQSIQDSEVDNNLTIDGGTINNSVIGGTTAAAGSFTTVSASGLASLNGGATVGSDATDLVTVNAVVQGATPLVFEGATANTSETTFAITDPTVDRTITFPDAAGEVSLLAQTIQDSEVDNNLTIDGGTINNSVIGGTTAAAGSFTTVSASGLASLNGGASLGTQTLSGTTAVINFTNFDVSNAGAVSAVSFSGDGSGLANVSVSGISSTTDAIIRLDSDNNGTNSLLVRDGAASPNTVFSVAESGAVAVAPVAALTTAIDLTDTDITNAISIADNTIAGTTAVIDFTNFDVSSTGSITAAGALILVPSATQSIAAAGTIAINAGHVKVVGSPGAVTASLGAGGADGQIVYIRGTNDTNTVTINDTGNANLGAARTLGNGDILALIWDSGAATWFEISFANN